MEHTTKPRSRTQGKKVAGISRGNRQTKKPKSKPNNCAPIVLPAPTFTSCPVKGCTRVATERHHVLYDHHEGGPVIKALCPEHHSWITRRQAHAGRKQHYPLTVRQRWFFYGELTRGEMKRPRLTRLDKEWADSQ